MALDRQEYPAVLATLSHGDAVEVLNERVRLVGQLNNSVADWLLERRKIEEQYSSALRKLSRRPAIADPASLGIFATPWSALVANLENLADAHSNLSSKIESDLERPLREYGTSNREMQQMSTIQGNLASLSKDVDGAQKKVDKAGARGGTGQKLAMANTDMESARSQWESQAPFVFENLQALDEARINHLRDILTQLQTHEVDKVERSRLAAEQCLNVLLTVDTADEIKMFALRTASGERSAMRNRPPPALQSSASFASLPPSTPGPADDRGSQRSDSLSELPTPKSDKPRGLRRLGTVLSRRRESKVPVGADRISESADRTVDKRASRLPTSASFANFGRSARSRDNMLEVPQEEEAERPRSPLRTISSLSDAPQHSGTVAGTNGTPSTAATKTNGETLEHSTGSNGGLPASNVGSAARPVEVERTLPGPGDGSSGSAIDAIFQAERDADQQQTPQAYKVDIRDAASGDAAGDDVLTTMANTLKMQGSNAGANRKQGPIRGRRENRASVYDSLSTGISPAADVNTPIVEKPQVPPTNARAAPSGISSAPIGTSPAPSSTLPAPLAMNSGGSRVAPQESGRKAIDTSDPTESNVLTDLTTGAPPTSLSSSTVPNLLPPAPPSTSSIGGLASSALTSNDPRTPVSSAFRNPIPRDDTASIRSGRSQSSVASASHRHPETTSPGLNSSTIETVSATFEGGKLVRSAVLGEIALTNNTDATSASETIRLRNISGTDKVAPNPAFISNDAAAEGVYTLNLAQLGRSKQQVAFKYQISGAGRSPAGLVPLIVHPQWKAEAAQMSVIVSYSLHPAFVPTGTGSVTLKEVTLLLQLSNEGGKPTSCLSKPVGTFNKERGVLYWTLGDVTLDVAGPPTKLLARFQTDGEAKAGRAEARWTLEGAGSEATVEIRHIKEQDPFSDAEASESWDRIGGKEARRRLVAGQYIGL